MPDRKQRHGFRPKQTIEIRDLGRASRREAPVRAREGMPPVKRGECMQVVRPCPFVGCRYHLFLNVNRWGGVNFPYGSDPAVIADMPTTCALDVAAGDPLTLKECGLLMNLNRERIRQLEEGALAKFKAYFKKNGIKWEGEMPREDEVVRAPGRCSTDRLVRLSNSRAYYRR